MVREGVSFQWLTSAYAAKQAVTMATRLAVPSLYGPAGTLSWQELAPFAMGGPGIWLLLITCHWWAAQHRYNLEGAFSWSDCVLRLACVHWPLFLLEHVPHPKTGQACILGACGVTHWAIVGAVAHLTGWSARVGPVCCTRPGQTCRPNMQAKHAH